MASDSKPLALLVLINTKSPEKKDQLVALNKSSQPFLKAPSTQHTTRTVFAPTTRPKANLGLVPAGQQSTLLGFMEVWTSPAAFAAVQKKPEFKAFHGTVAKEGLFEHAKDMQITEWIPAAGFVARKAEKESPKAGIVMLAKFVLKEENLDANRDGLVGVLG